MFPKDRQYTIEYVGDLTPESTQKTIDDLYGPGFTVKDVADLVGAADDSLVKMKLDAEGLLVAVDHKYFTSRRILNQNFISNETFDKKDGAPPGIGTRMLLQETKYAQKFGINEIRTFAGGSPKHSSMNGYYTWSRNGFNQPMMPTKKAEAEAAGFGKVTGTQELFAQPGGSAWWKANGRGNEATFDTRPGSTSMKMLRSYASTLGISTGNH